MKLTVFAIVGALLLVAAPSTAQTDPYTFTRIDYPGAATTRLIGLNDHLDMVGHYIMPGSVRHALLVKLGRFIPLDPDGILGTHASAATQINNRGDITGWYVDSAGRHGFVLTDGALTTIDYPGASLTQVNGISDDGLIFGHYCDTFGVYHGFTLRGDAFSQLDFPGAVDTLPFYINARGDIAGEWDPDPSVVGHGFLLTNGGDWISIDAPGSLPDSTLAIGINDRRDILGYTVESSGRVRGFVVNARDLTPDGFVFFYTPGASGSPETMNNSGVFVGYYSDAEGVHGFLASPNR